MAIKLVQDGGLSRKNQKAERLKRLSIERVD
jgi:hypothetical protein